MLNPYQAKIIYKKRLWILHDLSSCKVIFSIFITLGRYDSSICTIRYTIHVLVGPSIAHGIEGNSNGLTLIFLSTLRWQQWQSIWCFKCFNNWLNLYRQHQFHITDFFLDHNKNISSIAIFQNVYNYSKFIWKIGQIKCGNYYFRCLPSYYFSYIKRIKLKNKFLSYFTFQKLNWQ